MALQLDPNTCYELAIPGILVLASVLSKLPEWIGGLFQSPADISTPPPALEDEEEPPLPASEPIGSGDSQSLVDEMLAQGRYALLLRPQLVGNLTAEQAARTRDALADGMCLVPEGDVSLQIDTAPSGPLVKQESMIPPIRVEAFYLDRYPVTNAQFYRFVASGGYEQMAIWDREIWSALLDFVDATGQPGPRFWKKGRYPKGEDDHPVVGISWFEAAAYARWAGKRLPTDAEWVKAGSWPVALEGQRLLARRYPWGDAVDRSRANLWGSGPGRTVSVKEFPGGVSVGGVHQLIGNAWEWMADSFQIDPDDREGNNNPTRMRSLRGGAFDTYLDSQATCQFGSGDEALARKHNIGFRCAISLCDIAPRVPAPEFEADLEGELDAQENQA